ncbi:hypothetical protein [Actinacidiphila sp. ITFR-21]|uniref:SCO2583 family membrane protein n=1 Tax=Actinacidiphila sp. ITFR-21 TaxID=3075199 RepID=UPI002889C310|nr:hypothetical protein [Streptomyces sp. ITFR-21]WNI15470.1 hypothetical protein RLT57_07975 [Streptomyces sp. ITFR-21]
MSGSADPPQGTPEGAPGGGDDEYRSVVFDESFVRAARIQEFSAQERLAGAPRAVRIRHVLPRGLARQAVALMLLIVLAFGFAIYMGVRHPYRAAAPGAGARLQVTVIPLVPAGPVPAVPADAPFTGAAAAHYPVGVEGLNPPPAHRVGDFDRSEVRQAYDTAREYLFDSGVDRQTVTGGDVRKVRDLLDPGQLDQFDSSLTSPAADGRHEATGWLVRFDPAARVTLVGDIRVQGTLDAGETSDDQLEISADHTFVYALRGPGSAEGAASLFTVRRQLRFRFDHRDLRDHHIEVVEADVAAGPLPCAHPVQGFRPILAGDTAPGPVADSDPYDHDRPVGAVCAPLSPPAEGPPTTVR